MVSLLALEYRHETQHLGFVTNRTSETFCADTIPVLMLPPQFVEAGYGPAALKLGPGEDVAGHRKRASSDAPAVRLARGAELPFDSLGDSSIELLFASKTLP